MLRSTRSSALYIYILYLYIYIYVFPIDPWAQFFLFIQAIKNLGVKFEHEFSCDVNVHARTTIEANFPHGIMYLRWKIPAASFRIMAQLYYQVTSSYLIGYVVYVSSRN